MALPTASDNKFPKLILEERLSDGSDTANPAADHRALFLGEDGLLYLRDSAGTVTSPSASGAVATDAIWDAKGDLAGGTGANTAARLAAAANGASLVTASGETTGLKWRLNNDAAGAAPTVNDDTGDGYSIGSRWLDTTNDKEYVCLDATAAAAVWVETTATGGGGSGALTLITQGTASSQATLDFTAVFTSTYDEYLLETLNFDPATSGDSLCIRFGYGGTPTWDAGSNYYNGSGNASFILLSGATTNAADSYGHASATVRIINPQSTTRMKHVYGQGAYHNGTFLTSAVTTGLWADASNAATSLRILWSTGNIVSGIARIYGIQK